MTDAPSPPRRKRRRSRVPRRIRRALLLFGWVASSGLLAVEIVESIRQIGG